ncbi:MAG TPA: hypothetical protein VLE89_00095 [Chlamydiales bacterium]|nr:hypothetical protein [Chlamydiales bacterium]
MSFGVGGLGGGEAVEYERLDSEDDKIGILGASQTIRTGEAAAILNRYDLSNVESLEAGRVTQLPESIIDFAEELSPEGYEQFQKESKLLNAAIQEGKFLPEEANFIIKLRDIIAYSYRQRDRLMEKDRLLIENLKTEFKKAIQDQASFQRKIGTIGVIFAVASFVVSLGQLKFANNEAMRNAIQLGAQQVPTLGQFFSNRWQGDLGIRRGTENLSLNGLQQEQANKQTQGNAEQEKSRVLDKAMDVTDSVSRAR